MRGFIVGLICGVIVMAVAGGISLELLKEPAPSEHPSPAPTATIAVVDSSRSAGSDPAEIARRLETADDKAIAEALDAAEFDRDWGKVNGVGRVLRGRTAMRVDPLTGIAEAANAGASRTRAQPLVALEAEVARRVLVLDLRAHDNPAVRLIDHAGEDEAATKLADLFTAEARGQDYEPVRADAAIVLALGGSERGRSVLMRPTKEGGERGALAAKALGLSDDDKALALLEDLVAHDLDPEVRKRAVFALSKATALARGQPDAVTSLANAARSDHDESVRVKAIAALGATDLARVDQARTLLAAILREESEPEAVRIAAVEAIKAHRERAHATPGELALQLLNTVGSEHDGLFRETVALALVSIAPPSSVPTLESAQRASEDNRVRDALAKAIAAAKERGEPPP